MEDEIAAFEAVDQQAVDEQFAPRSEGDGVLRDLSAGGELGAAVTVDEFHQRSRIVEPVDMADAGFGDERDVSPQGLVAFRDNPGVLFPRHGDIGIAIDVDEGDFCLGQRLEVIDRIEDDLEKFLFGFDVVGGEQARDFRFVARAFAQPQRPGLDVADRAIRINAGDAVRVGRGPVEAVEAAAADSDIRGLRGESMLLDQLLVKRFPGFERFGRTEEILRFQMDDVVATAEQGDFRFGAMSEELGPPDPGTAWCGDFGGDNDCAATSDLEVVPIKPLPLRHSAGKRLR